MPTYEYQCFSCNAHFEEFQRMSDDPIKVCPKCGAENVKRLIAATAFHLKGSGWYKTDYASGSSSSSSSTSSTTDSGKSDAAAPAAESPSSTATESAPAPKPVAAGNAD